MSDFKRDASIPNKDAKMETWHCVSNHCVSPGSSSSHEASLRKDQLRFPPIAKS